MNLMNALDGAVRATENALDNDMRTLDGRPAAPALERLRQDLLGMRARGVVGADELRTMIRDVASWAPEDDVTLLAALGVIARANAGGRSEGP
jgi:hypothetical protein